MIQAWTAGWTLNGRLLRPAMVVVAKAATRGFTAADARTARCSPCLDPRDQNRPARASLSAWWKTVPHLLRPPPQYIRVHTNPKGLARCFGPHRTAEMEF